MEKIIITRHPGLVEYLRQAHPSLVEGAEALEHATPSDIEGRHVIGVLPLALAALAARITEVPLRLTPELRGVELTAAQVAGIAGTPVTYVVEVIA